MKKIFLLILIMSFIPVFAQGEIHKLEDADQYGSVVVEKEYTAGELKALFGINNNKRAIMADEKLLGLSIDMGEIKNLTYARSNEVKHLCKPSTLQEFLSQVPDTAKIKVQKRTGTYSGTNIQIMTLKSDVSLLQRLCPCPPMCPDGIN